MMNSMRSRIMLGCDGHFIPKLRVCDKGKHFAQAGVIIEIEKM